MIPHWLSLIPPLLVIIAAFVTGRINSSILLGIITAAFISTNGEFTATISLILHKFLASLYSADNLYLYSFLLSISILVAIMTHAGHLEKFAHIITKKIKTKLGVQQSSVFLSSLLFIDDYLSILTTGYVMQSLTDRFGIARVKLAFLIHSMAGPLVILAPVSGWVATIIGYLNKAGVESEVSLTTQIICDPFFLYLKSIPYIFYSFLIIISVLYIIHAAVSFGPMKKHEKRHKTPEYCELIIATTYTSYTTWAVLIPLGVLIFFIIIGIPISGGYMPFISNVSFIDSIKNNPYPFFVMFLAGISSLAVAFSMNLIKRSISFLDIPSIIMQGIQLMYPAIIMLFLAFTFSSLLARELGTGIYLAQKMIHSMHLAYIPFMFYISSLFATVATGTAWGTFAIMIPIAIPMIIGLTNTVTPTQLDQLPLLLPVLGAIFSGAACGDHLSPLSETTTMSATCTNVKPMEHFKTQLPYALPAAVSAGIAYLIIGFCISYQPLIGLIAAFIISITSCLLMLQLAHKRFSGTN